METPSHQPLRFVRVWRTCGAALIVLVVYLSLTPDPVSVPGPNGDKVGHLLAYAVLMGWFAQIDRGRMERVLWAIFFVALGVGLEFVQGLTDYRTFDIFDMAGDAVGVAVGWLAAPPRVPKLLAWFEKGWTRFREHAGG